VKMSALCRHNMRPSTQHTDVEFQLNSTCTLPRIIRVLRTVSQPAHGKHLRKMRISGGGFSRPVTLTSDRLKSKLAHRLLLLWRTFTPVLVFRCLFVFEL